MRPPVLVAASIVAVLACAPKTADKADTAAVQQAGAPTDAAAVKSAIDAAEAKWSAAMMKGDTATMTSIYADDAIFMAPDMKRATGRAAVSQMNAGMMKGMTFSGVSLKADDVIVSGDYAIETGTYRMTVHPKTGKAMDDVGKFISVWQKQPSGEWKMIRDIFNTDGAAK
jgi:uncharacterized protein (TIGR02246 family)